MPGETSGLQRDLEVIRRRGWLFVPFAVLGVLAAVFIGAISGEATAVATMTLDTTVHDLVIGGDRGLRIFEAQAMTSDPAFKQKVLEAIGDPDFDYARFSVSLFPISVGDGISRGTLTVSIADPSKAEAERYRAAFVQVFEREYTQPDGLFRTRFVERRREVARQAEAAYQAAYARLAQAVQGKGLDLELLIETRGDTNPAVLATGERLALERQLAEARGALEALNGASAAAAAAIASAVVGQPVAAGDASAVLTAQVAALESAIRAFDASSPALAEQVLDSETQALLNEVRGLRQVRDSAFVYLGNAQIAVGSAVSRVETSYSFSGGLTGSLVGRVAVALAVTVVFGLIAIYTVEWLSQARRSSGA
ncbi:hypothetical protein [Tepidiforma sp.]|uniref:hypothetical protein n=1 Tax=Tepidiforma sp. TaxID=2682230 RepID=UPI002ADDF565|nr:hypothetical protein [Tepidiforma sp.]